MISFLRVVRRCIPHICCNDVRYLPRSYSRREGMATRFPSISVKPYSQVETPLDGASAIDALIHVSLRRVRRFTPSIRNFAFLSTSTFPPLHARLTLPLSLRLYLTPGPCALVFRGDTDGNRSLYVLSRESRRER